MLRVAPTVADLEEARVAFETNESRDLFYRVATELVDLALRGVTSLSVAESLAVLLKTWNSAFYRFRKFDAKQFTALENLIADHDSFIAQFRPRFIRDFQPDDEPAVRQVFDSFERILGPVGAAKTLHLLAPRFFPLWDRAIAEVYGVSLGKAGTNAPRYLSFMKIAQIQVKRLEAQGSSDSSLLKSIDEFNYCKFTRGWI